MCFSLLTASPHLLGFSLLTASRPPPPLGFCRGERKHVSAGLSFPGVAEEERQWRRGAAHLRRGRAAARGGASPARTSGGEGRHISGVSRGGAAAAAHLQRFAEEERRRGYSVIADRNYASGEQVLIRYGKFPNATLLLDFGFTLPNNIHEQVQMSVGVPLDDPLHITKMELLQRHCLPTVENISTLSSSRGSFTMKEVRSLHGKGKGIPQSLRAFARVLSAKSLEELKEMCSEASENDGRLARRPLRSRSREIEAHCILISHIKSAIQEYNASIELLESRDTLSNATLQPRRRQMARDLLSGELRVLKSACSWLTNYCSC